MHQAVTVAGVQLDVVGLWLLAAADATVCALACVVLLRRWLASRRRMPPLEASALRLAAAQGHVHDLRLLSRLPRFNVDAAQGGWTALAAACVQGQAGVPAVLGATRCRLNF